MHHDIKSLKPYFQAVKANVKPFEIRKDDRGYQAGDTVTLHEIVEDYNTLSNYKTTSQTLDFTIGYVTAYEQKPGYVVFSLLEMGKK